MKKAIIVLTTVLLCPLALNAAQPDGKIENPRQVEDVLQQIRVKRDLARMDAQIKEEGDAYMVRTFMAQASVSATVKELRVIGYTVVPAVKYIHGIAVASLTLVGNGKTLSDYDGITDALKQAHGKTRAVEMRNELAAQGDAYEVDGDHSSATVKELRDIGYRVEINDDAEYVLIPMNGGVAKSATTAIGEVRKNRDAKLLSGVAATIIP